MSTLSIRLGDMTFSASERHALAHLMRAVGPDFETLCEGWNVKDLLIHLIIRENYPLAAVGMFVSLAQGKLRSKTAELEKAPFDKLLSQWENGSRMWPLAKLDRFVNVAEHFVHHEDVRRMLTDSHPRGFSRSDEAQLYDAARFAGKVMLKRSTVPVILEPTGWPRVVVHDQRGVTDAGCDVATIRGDIGEIVLWIFGREIAEVSVTDPAGGLHRSSV
ncbi:putative TIGR03085 family protein [Corynebacterium mustelae]|uniref:Putative TIGR03085 family protein n=2 Tax=Corynebacterium mustelae TaxID=571915 RepID=A0A0G3H088_9CORY|nr:putative TIGR03085 family protein [Corynebacterium mustelae]